MFHLSRDFAGVAILPFIFTSAIDHFFYRQHLQLPIQYSFIRLESSEFHFLFVCSQHRPIKISFESFARNAMVPMTTHINDIYWDRHERFTCDKWLIELNDTSCKVIIARKAVKMKQQNEISKSSRLHMRTNIFLVTKTYIRCWATIERHRHHWRCCCRRHRRWQPCRRVCVCARFFFRVRFVMRVCVHDKKRNKKYRSI